MQEYIKSATIKKYLSDNQIKLSDRHICALACNSLLAWNDVRKLFLEAAERTSDTDLKNQIAELTAAVEARINEFAANDDEYIYRLKVYSEEDSCYSEKGYYYSYDTAFDIAKAFGEKFKIKKLRTYKSREEAVGVLADEAVTEDEFCFNRDGQLEYQSIYAGIYDKRENRFEEEWYEFLHPFQKGDIVKRIRDSENGYDDYVYVICDTEDNGIRECYSDIGVWLTALDCKTGKIWAVDEPVHPYELEYYILPCEADRSVSDNVIEEMSNIIKGKSYAFQYIQDGCIKLREKYEDSNTRKLITGFEVKRKDLPL